MTVLIKMTGDWADEFDIECFTTMPSMEDYMAYKQRIETEHSFPCERYFGSNEFVTYEDAEEYFSHVEVIELTDEENAMLQRLFPYLQYGFGLNGFLDM